MDTKEKLEYIRGRIKETMESTLEEIKIDTDNTVDIKHKLTELQELSNNRYTTSREQLDLLSVLEGKYKYRGNYE